MVRSAQGGKWFSYLRFFPGVGGRVVEAVSLLLALPASDRLGSGAPENGLIVLNRSFVAYDPTRTSHVGIGRTNTWKSESSLPALAIRYRGQLTCLNCRATRPDKFKNKWEDAL